MVTGTHPDDIDLFDYVEGDMPDARRAELEVHLASCAQCAEQVARVQAGREELRESQFLQLSARRRDAIFLDLPPQRRESRRASFSLKPVLAVLVSAGAVAAIVVAVINVGDTSGGGEESAGGAAALTGEAPTAAESAGGGGTGTGVTQDRASKSRLLMFAGPADAVATELRRKGFDAEVVGDHVEVRGATRAEVRQALSERRDGNVRIVIVH